MNILTSIILGIVQGLTEFLPISSSGHLVLFQNLFGYREPELLLDTSLHLGTLFAVMIYFRADIKDIIIESWRFLSDISKRRKSISSINNEPPVLLALMVIIGTVPTGLIGIFFKDGLESLFGSVQTVGVMLIVTGLILISIKFMPKGYNNREKINLITALAVGVTQGLAIIPGISRSGSTIVCGMLCGTNRELAARFSFLLSIPAIIGAVLLQLGSNDLETVGFFPLLAGFLSAVIVGLIALRWLMFLVRKGSFFYFAPYCWFVGLVIIIVV